MFRTVEQVEGKVSGPRETQSPWNKDVAALLELDLAGEHYLQSALGRHSEALRRRDLFKEAQNTGCGAPCCNCRSGIVSNSSLHMFT